MAANARLFARWLELTQERKERKLLKKKPTNTEAEYISSALAQASEEELLQMLDWAFHGTDSYAKFIQGKTSFDAKAPQEYLSIPSLFNVPRRNICDAPCTSTVAPFCDWPVRVIRFTTPKNALVP